MRTSLNKLQEIEGFLMRQVDAPDALVFEARIIIDAELNQQVALQKDAYTLINKYGRRQLKQQLEAVHQQLFTQPKHLGFRQRVMALFR